ncbi:MAG: twin-arginine translocase subunit TatC [Nitrospiraceae bacterium]|nr:twin-arginine translocase subunit TatC [Nitrospiraceae bacterium]
MTFTEHLAELRVRIIRSGIAVGVCFIVCYIFSNTIFQVVSRPLSPLRDAGIITDAPVEEDGQSEAGGGVKPGEESPAEPDEKPGKPQGMLVRWYAGNPLEAFLVKLKLSAYAGILFAFPIVVYQLCAFIFPGLTGREQKAVRFLLVGCAFFVVFGVLVAYLGVFPLVLPYLGRFLPEGVDQQFRMNETVSMIIKGLTGFAVAFQFPMVVLILVYLDLLSPATLRQYRHVAIILMAVGSAVLTPPDPISMLIMLLPLVILYEMSIWMSYLVVRRRRKEQADSGTGAG